MRPKTWKRMLPADRRHFLGEDAYHQWSFGKCIESAIKTAMQFTDCQNDVIATTHLSEGSLKAKVWVKVAGRSVLFADVDERIHYTPDFRDKVLKMKYGGDHSNAKLIWVQERK